jgi:hypothetical protein
MFWAAPVPQSAIAIPICKAAISNLDEMRMDFPPNRLRCRFGAATIAAQPSGTMGNV